MIRWLVFSLLAQFAVGTELDLAARVQPLPEKNRFAFDGYYVWCGAPVKGGDGKYHLYYSRWPKSVGFAPGWAIHSEIAYAVAEHPNGPYQHVNVTLPKRPLNPQTGEKYWDGDVTHNPNAFFVEGKYYLYYMGNFGDGKSYPMHRNHQRIGLAVATNPAGPWKRLDRPIVDVSSDSAAFDSLCVTNPAACLRPDGGVLLIYKAVEKVPGKVMGGKVRYGAAIAKTPEGVYQKQEGNIFEAEKGSKHWMLAEDPFIWHSARYGNRYHAIARDVVGSFTGNAGGICLFTSVDGLDWKPAVQPKVLDSRYQLEKGVSATYLERPALLIEDGEPIYLFGAVDGYGKNRHNPLSSNMQIPLRKP